MDAERVALIARYAECDAIWLPADEERWEAHLTDDEPPRARVLLPDCTEREFGDNQT